MSIARKNYDVIARALGRDHLEASATCKAEVFHVMSNIADALAGYNGNFDRARFVLEFQRAAKLVERRLKVINQ